MLLLDDAPRSRGLIRDGWLHPALAFTRASAAAFVRSTDEALVEVGNDAPRFDPDLGLLIEGQRTNSIRNPRAEGASFPTNWYYFTNAGLSVTWSFGVTGGIRHTDVRISGTATGGTVADIGLEALNSVSASQGQTWTQSAWTALVAGSLANISSLNLRSVERDSGNEVIAGTAPANVGATLSRVSLTRTLTSPTTVTLVPTIRVVTTAGGAVDLTLRVWLPQLQQASFASSPILPPAGTPGVTTRLGELVRAPLPALGIGSNGVCTVVGTFMLPQLAPSGSIGAVLLTIDDGSVNRRVYLANEAGTQNIRLVGTNLASILTLGDLTPGVPLRIAFTVRSDGSSSASMNGGAAIASTGTPLSGLTFMRVGNTSSGNPALSGYVKRLAYLPRPTADADLPALSLRGVADLTGLQEIIQWP